MSADPSRAPPSRSDCAYQPYYCEENVWQLCANARVVGTRFAVFIASPSRVCPLWNQRGSTGPSNPVLWDYHVVLVARSGGRSVVYDLDSTLDFPCPLATYLRRTFAPVGALPKENEPLFRVFDGDVFRRHFASDRSHMLGPQGQYLQPPPPWPAIVGMQPTIALHRDALSLEALDLSGRSQLLTLADLPRFFRKPAARG